MVAADPPHGLHLAREPPARDVVAGHLGAEDLHGHLPPLWVDREVDDAHAALTEPPEQSVGAQSVVLIHGMKNHTGLNTAHEMNHQAIVFD
ncbi:hypothetical protein GCM10023075_51560 [Streptosporangium album]